MPVVKYYIDPDPDTVIVLKNPCEDFAPWAEEASKETNAPKPTTKDEDGWKAFLASKPRTTKKMSKKAQKLLLLEYRESTKDDSIRRPHENQFGGEFVEASGELSGSMHVETLVENGIGHSMQTPEKELEEGVHYYVSSRHLRLASPWFHRTLTNEAWNESTQNGKDGLFHITAEDWDSDAFLTLLNVFHLRNRKVPRQTSLEELAKIAVLVDYYECAEAVELFISRCIEELKKTEPIPSMYCRDLILWILVSWVFDLAEQFEFATLIAIQQCSEPIRTLGLPIPVIVSEKFDLGRCEAIELVIGGLHSLRNKYKCLDYVCPQNKEMSFVCGSMLYGAITKGMISIRLLSPRPEIPFTGMSFEQLCSNVQKMKSPSWHHYSCVFGSQYTIHTCSLVKEAIDVVSGVTSTVVGLSLDSVKKAA